MPVEAPTPLDISGPLVARAQRGELAAFESLYRANVARIFAVVRRISGQALAEELTQEVFVRAFERLDSFRGESAFSTWLHRLAVNVALEDRRKTERRDRRVSIAGDPTLFENSPANTRERSASMDLERAIEALPERARAVLVLHDIEGYQHEEIASLLEITAGTSKSQLHRARKLLREALGR